MNKRERQICSRLKELRERLDQSQRNFSVLLGIGRDQLASIEYGRTPLRSGLALTVAAATGCNLQWLAEGSGPQLGPLPSPDLTAQIPSRSLFSKTWDTRLKVLFRAGSNVVGKNPVAGSFVGGAGVPNYLNEEMSGILNFLPPEFHPNFFAYITKAGRDFIKVNRAAIIELNAKRGKSKTDTENQCLTKKTSGLKFTGEVKNQWPALKRDIQKAVSAPGKRTILAKFLGVGLDQLSKWLADKKFAREPGAEYALRMQFWVRHPELQK
jgi:transcriptional regulator with XRE-family HTH domain